MPAIQSQTHRRQTLSLNDLEHILEKHNITMLETKKGVIKLRSTHQCSSEFSFDSNWFPAGPLEAAHPPPARIKTPPGLPSFGTTQATLLRLPQQRSSKASLRLRNWLHSHDESNERVFSSGSASSIASPPLSLVGSPPLSPTSPPSGPSDTREMLRRTLAAIGMTRLLDPDPAERATSALPQGSLPTEACSFSPGLTLPPWVYMTNVPGPLARADDGTYMRGTFGPRGSGHGVGARNVNMLPMARLAKRTPIPTQVPAETPATLTELRRTDAASGRRSTSAIGPDEQERSACPHEEKGRNDCKACCWKFCEWFCNIPI